MKNIKNIGLVIIIIGITSLSKPVISQENKPLSQTIRGQVVDQESQASLPGANIIILNTNPLKATITDSEGNFRIDNVPIGRHNIQVSYVGYKSFLISEMQVTITRRCIFN